MRVVASIQARMASTRLPGKVMRPILDRPMLGWQVARLRRSRLIDEVWVATSTSTVDDPIVAYCELAGIPVFRGEEADVLKRIASLLDALSCNIHVECYGDSPLVDPQIVDEFVGYLLVNWGTLDCVTSALKTSYPPGIETTAYKPECLLRIDTLIDVHDPLREHSAFNLFRFPDEVRVAQLSAPPHFAYPDVFLEVDTSEDFAVITQLAQYLGPEFEHAGLERILSFAHMDTGLFEKNKFVKREWRALREQYGFDA